MESLWMHASVRPAAVENGDLTLWGSALFACSLHIHDRVFFSGAGVIQLGC